MLSMPPQTQQQALQSQNFQIPILMDNADALMQSQPMKMSIPSGSDFQFSAAKPGQPTAASATTTSAARQIPATLYVTTKDGLPTVEGLKIDKKISQIANWLCEYSAELSWIFYEISLIRNKIQYRRFHCLRVIFRVKNSTSNGRKRSIYFKVEFVMFGVTLDVVFRAVAAVPEPAGDTKVVPVVLLPRADSEGHGPLNIFTK